MSSNAIQRRYLDDTRRESVAHASRKLVERTHEERDGRPDIRGVICISTCWNADFTARQHDVRCIIRCEIYALPNKKSVYVPGNGGILPGHGIRRRKNLWVLRPRKRDREGVRHSVSTHSSLSTAKGGNRMLLAIHIRRHIGRHCICRRRETGLCPACNGRG